MAEKVREQRAEGRERRRSLAAKPFEELDAGAANGAESSMTPLAAAKGVAATAAAAAVAGAIAGAAKALRDRGSARADDDAHEEAEHEPPDDEAAERHVEDDAPTGDEPEEAEPEEDDDEEESQPVPPAAENEGEPPEDEEDEPQQTAASNQDEDEEPEADDNDVRDGASGGSPGDAMQVVAQARDHLKNLLGADAESISGIERSNGNWEVKLEVVEMRRIPESTDILSSYTAVLDDDGGIVSLTRGRRYRRSQVEEG